MLPPAPRVAPPVSREPFVQLRRPVRVVEPNSDAAVGVDGGGRGAERNERRRVDHGGPERSLPPASRPEGAVKALFDGEVFVLSVVFFFCFFCYHHGHDHRCTSCHPYGRKWLVFNLLFMIDFLHQVADLIAALPCKREV